MIMVNRVLLVCFKRRVLLIVNIISRNREQIIDQIKDKVIVIKSNNSYNNNNKY